MSTEEQQPVPEAESDTSEEIEQSPQEGYLGFTLRELLIVGTWIVMFVLSFVPVLRLYGPAVGVNSAQGSVTLSSADTLWQQGIAWIIPVGLPAVAVFLLVLRRFSPQGIRRVGSLGIDQFASVTAVFALLYWAQLVWAEYQLLSISADFFLPWLVTVELICALALVVFTVAAPFIPRLKEDFQGRPVIPGHRNASTVRRVVPRPRPEKPEPTPEEKPAADEDVPAPSSWPQPAVAWTPEAEEATRTSVIGTDFLEAELSAPVSEQTEAFDLPAEETAGSPFWVLAPTERDVVDEQDRPLFRVGPTAWALVIEDRGGAYLIRHDDGRVGFLHDIADVTKG